MNEDIRLFRDALLAEVKAEATTAGDYQRTRFVDRICQILEEVEELDEYAICHVTGEWKRGRLAGDAYAFSEVDGILNLVVADFSGEADPEPLMTDDVKRLVSAAYRFLEGSIYGDAANIWDESHLSHQLAKRVFEFSTESLTKARLFLLSDREISPQLGKLPEFKLGTHPVEVHLWGIDRLHRADTATGGRGRIEIDFVERFGHGIPALPAALDGSDYRSYMCVVPGAVLASLYDRYGGRILEQNVRAFLGDTRKVNRGIRETLRERPEMFFAFNNGLTATASSVDAVEDGDALRMVTDFQVVNGGQTTASLYWAQKAGIDLSRVFVQMKLSVLPEDGFEDAVHDIARYANAQNAVSAADLFAGHPYFKRLEKLSRQILAPPNKSATENTYWFFERAQGSYNLELKRLKGMAAKFWQTLNPKLQKLTKTDVSRYEVTWASAPHSVCQGAQKNIAMFGKLITDRWAQDPESFNEQYYRRMIAKCLLIRAVDKAIPLQPWYPGSILRQLTTYTVALMCERMAQKGLEPDLDAIWKAQAAPAAFVAEAMRIAAAVNRIISIIPDQFVKNRLVTEWVKREACWDEVRGSHIALSSEFLATLVESDRSGSMRQAPWHTRSRELWSNGSFKRLWAWLQDSPTLLSEGEMDTIHRTAIASEFALRGFRLKKLEEAWKKAVDAGFV